jgi:hypothetical protein
MNQQSQAAEVKIPVEVVEVTHKTEPHLDSTYFRTSDVTPFFKDGKLHVYDFRGKRRSWGSPTCSSEIEMLTDNVIQVYVVGWHKHTVSPVGGHYYFVREGDEWVRRTARAKVVKAALVA